MIRKLALAAVLAVAGGAAMAQGDRVGDHVPANNYPTAARADYLDRCACGIDTIADQMSYDDYEKADTILRMQQGGLGERGAMFRDTPIAKEETEKLRRAQAEVNLNCH